jgi:transposase
MTTLLPPNVNVHLALGFIDMRKGIDGLAMLVQAVLQQDPFTGHLFVFQGRARANLIKIIYWDGTGLPSGSSMVFSVAAERLSGRDAVVDLGKLSLLIEGVDWRAPEQRWRPATAG